MIKCTLCDGTGRIEVMGDGANFEWDVIGHRECSDCDGTGELEAKYPDQFLSAKEEETKDPDELKYK